MVVEEEQEVWPVPPTYYNYHTMMSQLTQEMRDEIERDIDAYHERCERRAFEKYNHTVKEFELPW